MTEIELKIRVNGDPCLRKKSSPVKEIGPSERILISSMIKTMHENQGIGFAAPQVGINKRIFVADIGEGPVAMINPRIIKKQGYHIMEEGCLSIPGVAVYVKRPEKIIVKYLDENSNVIQREYNGLFAKVVQHENDHLNGKLIIDYASLREKLKFRKQLKGLRKSNKQKLSEEPTHDGTKNAPPLV